VETLLRSRDRCRRSVQEQRRVNGQAGTALVEKYRKVQNSGQVASRASKLKSPSVQWMQGERGTGRGQPRKRPAESQMSDAYSAKLSSIKSRWMSSLLWLCTVATWVSLCCKFGDLGGYVWLGDRVRPQPEVVLWFPSCYFGGVAGLTVQGQDGFTGEERKRKGRRLPPTHSTLHSRATETRVCRHRAEADLLTSCCSFLTDF